MLRAGQRNVSKRQLEPSLAVSSNPSSKRVPHAVCLASKPTVGVNACVRRACVSLARRCRRLGCGYFYKFIIYLVCCYCLSASLCSLPHTKTVIAHDNKMSGVQMRIRGERIIECLARMFACLAWRGARRALTHVHLGTQ